VIASAIQVVGSDGQLTSTSVVTEGGGPAARPFRDRSASIRYEGTTSSEDPSTCQAPFCTS
jgi:hypothetical protein